MEDNTRKPVIRVYPQTRMKLKVEAAKKNKTMQDFVDWLVDQHIEREREMEEQGHAKQDV